MRVQRRDLERLEAELRALRARVKALELTAQAQVTVNENLMYCDHDNQIKWDEQMRLNRMIVRSVDPRERDALRIEHQGDQS